MSYNNFYRKFYKLVLVCAFFGALFSTSTSSAQAQTTTFAQFFERNGTQDFVFNNNTTNATFNTVGGGSAILFIYQNISGLNASLQGGQNAHLFITTTTTTTPATLLVNTLNQPLDQTVVISILRDTPAPVGTGARTNLLTATITTATAVPSIAGPNTGNSANFTVTTPDNNITFTSDFVSFAATTQRNLGLSFSSVTPQLALGTNNFLQSFTAAGAGTFASNPPPTVPGVTAAAVTVGGRVLTPTGRGLRNALVTLKEADGTTRTVLTGNSGLFSFPDLTIPQTIVVTVRSKSYRFIPRIISPDADFNDLEFMGLGR